MSVGAALATVLRGGRGEFNRRFELASARYPGIEAAAFAELLMGPIDRIAEQIEGVDAAALPTVIDTLYELSLSLLGQRWIGPGGKAPAVLVAWQALAEQTPLLLAQQPSLFAAMANALVHWSSHGGGDEWLSSMRALAGRARSGDELLCAGQVAAWRHGMAHYRDSALERARTLDRELLAIALGLAPVDWDDGILHRLSAQRWYRPDIASAAEARVVAQVGAFVGFGGRFDEPPVAGLVDGELVLDAGAARFSLHADAYGAQVMAHAEGQRLAGQGLPSGWRIEGGILISPAQRFNFAERGAITSSAFSADTLVITHAWSHSATLLALP